MEKSFLILQLFIQPNYLKSLQKEDYSDNLGSHKEQ